MTNNCLLILNQTMYCYDSDADKEYTPYIEKKMSNE